MSECTLLLASNKGVGKAWRKQRGPERRKVQRDRIETRFFVTSGFGMKVERKENSVRIRRTRGEENEIK
jgi:hypothetical protein